MRKLIVLFLLTSPIALTAQTVGIYGEAYGLLNSVKSNSAAGGGVGAGLKLARFNIGAAAEAYNPASGNKTAYPVYGQVRFFVLPKVLKVQPFAGAYGGRLFYKSSGGFGIDGFSQFEGKSLLGADAGIKINLVQRVGVIASVGLRRVSIEQRDTYAGSPAIIDKYNETSFIAKLGIQF